MFGRPILIPFKLIVLEVRAKSPTDELQIQQGKGLPDVMTEGQTDKTEERKQNKENSMVMIFLF